MLLLESSKNKKSFALLLVIKALLICSLGVFLELYQLVPFLVGGILTSMYLFWIYPKSLKKLFSLQQTQIPQFESIDTWRAPSDEVFVLAIADLKNISIIFSSRAESLLTQEERTCIIKYYLQAHKQGWIFFMTLITFFIRILSTCLNLNFRQKKNKKQNFIYKQVLKIVAIGLRKVFLKMDQLSLDQAESLSFTLWKMESLYQVHPGNLWDFLAPLYLANPLTHAKNPGYIPIQPRIRKRVQALIHAFPPYKRGKL